MRSVDFGFVQVVDTVGIAGMLEQGAKGRFVQMGRYIYLLHFIALFPAAGQCLRMVELLSVQDTMADIQQ